MKQITETDLNKFFKDLYANDKGFTIEYEGITFKFRSKIASKLLMQFSKLVQEEQIKQLISIASISPSILPDHVDLMPLDLFTKISQAFVQNGILDPELLKKKA